MMFKGKNIFDASFDVYAANYHHVRPGYPSQLFADLQTGCDIGRESRVLEIGAGSGIATVELAKYDCEVVAIEPGGNLAEIAMKGTAGLSNVKVVEGTFEDFWSPDQFDAIVAFTAFHWIDEDAKYLKAVELLRPDGCLVLVWNSFFQGGSETVAEVNRAYEELLPDLYGGEQDVNKGVLSKLGRREQEISQSGLFNIVFLKKYLCAYNYDHETYPKLLETFPKIIKLDAAKRGVFLDRISEIVQRHGNITVPVLSTLIVCRRNDSFLKRIAEK
jgi:protein-L-isoaspartate O-methyltransferase